MASSTHGFLDSVRQLGDTLLSTVHDRLELFSLELQEEKFRVIRVLILVNAAIFSAFLALIFLSITVVYLFWDTARIWVLSGMTVVYAVICVVVLLALKKYASKLAAPFEATRQELAEDRDALRGR